MALVLRAFQVALKDECKGVLGCLEHFRGKELIPRALGHGLQTVASSKLIVTTSI